jgi:hypothetical protein
VDPGERRWVLLGGAIAIVGMAGCVIVVALWSAPKGLLESDPFMGCLAVVVLGLALIVAAGARDALLSDKDSSVLTLTRFGDPSAVADEQPPKDEVTIRPVFRNVREGDAYRTRYELALQRRDAIAALLVQASAPSVLLVRFDEVSIHLQESGAGAGHAWASVPDPPALFRLDVITGEPERRIELGGSVR